MAAFEKSLASVTTDLEQSIRIIGDRMIQTRKKGKIVYRPYRKNEVYFDRALLGMREVDLKKLYPDAKRGDMAYVGTILESVAEYDVNFRVVGNVKVIFRGETVYDYMEHSTEDKEGCCSLHLQEGENDILFLVRCDEAFSFSFMPSVRVYRMWAKDYILHVRATSPISAFRHEDGVGISALYTAEEPFDGVYIYPPAPKATADVIRFDEIFPDADGVCAYALTYALEDCNISLSLLSDGKVIAEGKEVSANGFSVKKGDAILVKSVRGDNWGFRFDTKLPLGIPFLESFRGCAEQWLTIGTFGSGNCLQTPFGPELSLQFTTPYRTEKWSRTFWKLASADDYIRVYMDTCFFSQWFYALMVGHFGLLAAGKALGDSPYLNYFIQSAKYISTYFEYAQYEYEVFGQPTFLQKSVLLNDLDSIGTIGMVLCEYYKLTSDSAAMRCIETLAAAMEHNIPRFEDGTFHRKYDMWSDDIFMSCPFLIRLGLVKKDRTYFTEAVRQFMGFKKRLWMEDKKIFSHIYFLNSDEASRVPWGRGNGWALLALADALENLPDDTEGRDELFAFYKEFAEGIAALQDEDGLWHQVLTRGDSYEETSCTGMFLIAFAKGIRNGWLDDTYKPIIERATQGLLREKIDSCGNIYDVCMGSGNSKDENYYVQLGAIDNDDHGTGIILAALSEMLQYRI